MKTVEVGGTAIPVLGLGTWQNTGPQCAETVQTALELGYRHLDTAQAYENEQQVGAGLSAASVSRGEVFLTTKVWRSNLRHDDVHSSVRRSLERLQVDAVDLLLIHWPHPRVPMAETLGAMDELVEAGLVDNIGVSNFTASQLEKAVNVADHPILTNQVLYHPYIDRAALLSVCRRLDVALTAYSPLARGRVLDDERLATIGQRHDASAAQVALRWLVEQDGVVAIPKATGREHLEANIAALDIELSDEEIAAIDGLQPGLLQRLRNVGPAVMRNLPV
ncbi:MAG: aldo/keto reductase [Salinirussus sp.]